jgi:hypothetical protein
VLEALSRLAPALLRHLFAYGELVRDEAGDALRLWRRQALGCALAVGAGLITLLMACVWVIAATWDGPYRLRAIGALGGGFAVIAAIGAWYASTGLRPGQPRPFERLRSEWNADLEQLSSLERPARADEAAYTAAPQVTPEDSYDN